MVQIRGSLSSLLRGGMSKKSERLIYEHTKIKIKAKCEISFGWCYRYSIVKPQNIVNFFSKS